MAIYKYGRKNLHVVTVFKEHYWSCECKDGAFSTLCVRTNVIKHNVRSMMVFVSE